MVSLSTHILAGLIGGVIKCLSASLVGSSCGGLVKCFVDDVVVFIVVHIYIPRAATWSTLFKSDML